jgi:hypothetical protein
MKRLKVGHIVEWAISGTRPIWRDVIIESQINHGLQFNDPKGNQNNYPIEHMFKRLMDKEGIVTILGEMVDGEEYIYENPIKCVGYKEEFKGRVIKD